jgi:hypothetical protein
VYDISTENAETKKEIEIRGRYLMMCCDIEYCLLNIIMWCNPDPNNHERAGQFKEMKMANKIESVICDMKKYRIQHYLNFKDAFDMLNEFRLIRNDICHCKGSFPNPPDLSVFRILYIEKEDPSDKQDKREFFMYRDYTEEFIEKSINDFGKLNNHLGTLWKILYDEWSSKNQSIQLG